MVIRRREHHKGTDTKLECSALLDDHEDRTVPAPQTEPHGIPDVRPGSPEPKCAICLSMIENAACPESCFHKFCFHCLQRWSQVKRQCPLCKAEFRRIFHAIKSDDHYKVFEVQEPEPTAPNDEQMQAEFLQRYRRFRYLSAHFQSGDVTHQTSVSIAFQILPNAQSRPRISVHGLNRRRSGLATSEYRRSIYSNRLYVVPDSGLDVVGRFRECSPQWYRNNPAQTHRLMPWLSREMNALLENSPHSPVCVMELILTLITQVDICSSTFRERLRPYLGDKTNHFQHEFYSFARSVYDMIGYDRHAIYSENVPPLLVSGVRHFTDDDQDVTLLPIIAGSSSAGRQLPLQSEVNAASAEPMPSTSHGARGWNSGQTDIVISSDSSDDDATAAATAASTTDADEDEVQIIACVKPERTPLVVTLLTSSDEAPSPIDLSKGEADDSRVGLCSQKGGKGKGKGPSRSRYSMTSQKRRTSLTQTSPRATRSKRARFCQGVSERKSRSSSSDSSEDDEPLARAPRSVKKRPKRHLHLKDTDTSDESDGPRQKKMPNLA